MARTRVTFLCRACGSSHPKWQGKCPDCGAWDSLEKFTPPPEEEAGGAIGAAAQWLSAESGVGGQAQPLEEVSTADAPRCPSGIAEFDRVLGGGFVPGSVVLLGGDPGIGKSTLLLQAAARLADGERTVLYVSSEESVQQVKLRAERVIASDGAAVTDAKRQRPSSGRSRNLFVLSETNLPRIAEQARRVKPALLVVDSVQMLWTSGVEAAPGSVAQLRRACLELVLLAKATGMAVAVVGHVTKEGELAGPKLLEHLVDVVLQFEGDRHHAYRVVRAIKNRFGSTHEIGLFEMTGGGLAEVREGSLSLGAGEEARRPGTVFVPAIAGSRCLIAEIQALTATSFLGAAKRRASGFDGNRLAMLIAVLEKHGGLRLADQDVFAQAAGGLKVAEPAADLAAALAIAGAHYGRTAPPAFAAIGEVGLTGEVRPVRQLEQRVAEVVRRGGQVVLVPRSQADDAAKALGGIAPAVKQGGAGPLGRPQVLSVRSVGEAIEFLAPAPVEHPARREGRSVKA